jgi:hypothetical protein
VNLVTPHHLKVFTKQNVFKNMHGTKHGLQFTSHCQPETVYATNVLHEIYDSTNFIKQSQLLQPSFKQQNQECKFRLTSCPYKTVFQTPTTSNAHVLCYQSNALFQCHHVASQMSKLCFTYLPIISLQEFQHCLAHGSWRRQRSDQAPSFQLKSWLYQSCIPINASSFCMSSPVIIMICSAAVRVVTNRNFPKCRSDRKHIKMT